MRRAKVLILAVVALVEAGCLVEIHHVPDAGAAFRDARAEVERLQDHPGRAHRLNVLVYDPDERELVRVSMPLWLARKLEGHIDWGSEAGDAEDRAARRLARHLRVEDLARAGRGLLADVEDDDGGQVLVWLR